MAGGALREALRRSGEVALYDDPVLLRGRGALCSPTGLVSTASPGTVALSAWRRGRRMGQDGAGNGPQAGTHENGRSPATRRGRAGRQARQGDPSRTEKLRCGTRGAQPSASSGHDTRLGDRRRSRSWCFVAFAVAAGRARQSSPRSRLKGAASKGLAAQSGPVSHDGVPAGVDETAAGHRSRRLRGVPGCRVAHLTLGPSRSLATR